MARIVEDYVHLKVFLSLIFLFDFTYLQVPESPDKNGYQHRAYSNKFDGPSVLKVYITDGLHIFSVFDPLQVTELSINFRT